MIRKIQPRNLPGLQKHFETGIREIKKKIQALNIKKADLEKELSILQDGTELCDHLYNLHKPKPE